MTGDPTPYTKVDENQLAEWAKIADQQDGIGLEDASGFTIKADVEWAGETNPNAHRQLKVDGADLKGVAKALRGRPDGEPPRLGTYTAKGWHAQYNALQKTKAGREALAAELRVTDKTAGRWASGKQQPSGANQAAIKAAYEARATDAGAVGKATARADKRVANAFTQALEDRFGRQIRLTNISEIHLHE